MRAFLRRSGARFFGLTREAADSETTAAIALNAHGVALRLAAFYWAVIIFSWLCDVALLAGFNQPDFATFSRRVTGRLGWHTLAWSALAFIVLIAGPYLALHVPKRRSRFLRVAIIACGAATLAWIGWCFVRVAAFYYMRLDIDPSLAFYTLLELRALIVGEVLITLREIPVLVPLLFGLPTLFVVFVDRATTYAARSIDIDSITNAPEHRASTRRTALISIGVGVGLACVATLAFLPAQSGRDAAQSAADADARPLQGESPFPTADEISPRLYSQKNFFRERFGFNLPEDTNVVFIVLESARESFVDIEGSEFFRAGPETLRVQNFFAPVPHSSNSHYSLFTGLHSKRDFTEKYDQMRAADSLPRLLENQGYKNFYIYTDHTAFESEHLMLGKLGMRITEKKHLEKQVNPETGDAYASFPFGMDDVALLHAATAILDTEDLRHTPFTMSLVMTNSHYPYLNPHPEKFNKHNNQTILGRHRNGVDYGMFLADRVVAEFRKRGLDRKTLFVLLSDHGESFGERGFFRHSFSVYNEEVRVPLVFRHPQFARLASPADRELKYGSMLDVFPTIFDMLGHTYSASLHGRSLFDPEYEFRLPLWVWRLDDYRGFLHGETKYVYNTVDNELTRLDLHDRVQETWREPEGHALVFAETLMALDYGQAGGVAAGAGDRPGPAIRMDGKFVFGGSFRGGGGPFIFRCADLPAHLECVGDAARDSSETPGADESPAQKDWHELRKKFPELLP